MGLTNFQYVLAAGMLVSGSLNTIAKKVQNDFVVEGYPYDDAGKLPHKFDHPWFQTLLMFTGEIFCLIGLMVKRYKNKRDYQKQELQRFDPIDGEESVTICPQEPRIFHWVFILPTLCDLVGTSLAGIGLLYVSASVWQMLRGSIIIFAGILSKIFLKKNLRWFQWTGMLITASGLVLVGLSSVLKSSEEHTNPALGIALIVCAQLVSATQMIVEEVFVKKRDFDPLQVAGMEGLFGFVLMCAIVIPVIYFIPGQDVGGRYENFLDALFQIKNNVALTVFSVMYLGSIAFYNFFGLSVTKSLTAVHRTVIDALRTITVWIVDIIVFYAIDKRFGESWDDEYGIFQIDGFILLLIGTAIYNGLVDFSWMPCCRRDAMVINDTSDQNRSPNEDTSLLRGDQ